MSNTHHVIGHGARKVIVLHGWFGDSHAFAPVEPWLDRDAFTWVFMIYRGYGGMAMQRVLTRAPDRVRSLVGINPVPASGVPFDEQSWALFAGAAEKREAFAAYLTAWAKTDFSAEVKRLTHQVKVIVGEHDPALNAQVMKATYLARYPNAVMHILPGAGHYPMHETPKALVQAVESFLRH